MIGCTNFDETVNTLAPPYEVPCGVGSIYQETITGRFGIAKSTTQWGANVDFSNPLLPTSNLRMRVDTFDGTSVRGVIFGVFEVPVTPDASPPASISGELQFNFPFKIQ